MDVGRSKNNSLVQILIWQDGHPQLGIARSIASRLRSQRKEVVSIRVITKICAGDSLDCEDNCYEHSGNNNANYLDQLVEWTDLLVVACLQADTLAKMLYGFMDKPLLRLLRSWNVSKKAAIIPAMPLSVWENPMTEKQLSKIRRKWTWIRLFEPLVWQPGKSATDAYEGWSGMEECVGALENQVDLLRLGHDHPPAAATLSRVQLPSDSNRVQLPSEIWTMILEYTADWELAKSLGIYTSLPVPAEWQGHQNVKNLNFMQALEWTILIGKLDEVTQLFHTRGQPKSLSPLCVKLIFKFARIDLLTYLEANFKQQFWFQFGHTLIPTKASGVYGQTAVLEWWKTSSPFLSKDYNSDALDLASRWGHVHVLHWWHASGLPLRYTDAALEQASAQGRIEVLDWWKSASNMSRREQNGQSDGQQIFVGSEDSHGEGSSQESTAVLPPLQLKVGKSLIYAAQNGQAATIRWWMSSGIPTVHEEAVARTASAHGHVNILRLWKEIKGEKMQYDNQVLVGPTRNGHVEVLEWWKTSGYRAEYKTCDIEEALEDGVSDQKGLVALRWWTRNGLNLGVGTSEWMKVKIL
ncbi:MAG: hypothetical protein Q9219_000417 [cf. Caloplaca sp. 3 TL-2023]